MTLPLSKNAPAAALHAPEPVQVAVIQDGARRHYAVPAALQQLGMLDCLYTDYFLAPGTATSRWMRIGAALSSSVRQHLVGRTHPAIPGSKVHDFPLRATWIRATGNRRDATMHVRLLQAYARAFRRHLPANARVLYAFIPTCHPDLLKCAQDHGLKIIGDQIMATRHFLKQVLAEHAGRFPAWREASDFAEADTWSEEEPLWQYCDHLIGGSPFVRQSLADRGVAPDRISVIPHPLEASAFPFTDRSERSGPLSVGFIGQVGLRKGVPYLLEAAMRLPPRHYRFICIGPLNVSSDLLAPYRDRVEFIARIPRMQVPQAMAQFDLFVFPSLCEGSANAVNEAMASGLPVICTPNSGSRVVDGESGFIVPAGDIEALVQRIAQLGEDAHLRQVMGRAARQCIEQYTLDVYAQHLRQVVEQVADAPASSR